MTENRDDDWPPQPDEIAFDDPPSPELMEDLKAKSEHPDEER